MRDSYQKKVVFTFNIHKESNACFSVSDFLPCLASLLLTNE